MTTYDRLFEHYGPTLTMRELADVLNRSYESMLKVISAGACPVPSYREGKRRVAPTRAVAEYLDERARRAAHDFGNALRG